ncbi:MAG: N-acetyl-gamma-glutamyl-phosphate reductase [Paracoccaceae bacterium]|nr:N-acetyl-gamma-glutamyl-phosphate reductase [Paracoccaceae bacterium]
MKKVVILGASGYTGAELVRIISGHAFFQIEALVADRKAGQSYEKIFPHCRHLDLPKLVSLNEVDFENIDLVFCALPHATTQTILNGLPKALRIVDLSADFRLTDPKKYEKWYGIPHIAADLQKEAVYGLSEHYRSQIKSARLVACTGCNSAAGLFPLLPLVAKRIINLENIIVDLATGVSGAGRASKEEMLHAEISEGFSAYNVARHRHLAEFDQELSKAAGTEVEISFTPHLIPQNRGILATIYAIGSADEIHAELNDAYQDEPFVIVLPYGEVPSTKHVRGSNYCHIGVVKDRTFNRTILFSALDNLTKGSAGQAVQNANLMFGFDETEGLMMAPIFP